MQIKKFFLFAFHGSVALKDGHHTELIKLPSIKVIRYGFNFLEEILVDLMPFNFAPDFLQFEFFVG